MKKFTYILLLAAVSLITACNDSMQESMARKMLKGSWHLTGYTMTDTKTGQTTDLINTLLPSQEQLGQQFLPGGCVLNYTTCFWEFTDDSLYTCNPYASNPFERVHYTVKKQPYGTIIYQDLGLAEVYIMPLKILSLATTELILTTRTDKPGEALDYYYTYRFERGAPEDPTDVSVATASKRLIGSWAMIEEQREYYSIDEQKEVMEKHTYTTDASPFVWNISTEGMGGRNFEMPVVMGPCELEMYNGEVYILLDDAKPDQFGNTAAVIKILSLDGSNLRVVIDSRNADGERNTQLFQRL